MRGKDIALLIVIVSNGITPAYAGKRNKFKLTMATI